jgi:hypothetical protein
MDVTRAFVERGDLAHLALFLWASGASGLLLLVLKEFAAQTRRFDAFVGEIARLNHRLNDEGGTSTTAPK